MHEFKNCSGNVDSTQWKLSDYLGKWFFFHMGEPHGGNVKMIINMPILVSSVISSKQCFTFLKLSFESIYTFKWVQKTQNVVL